MRVLPMLLAVSATAACSSPARTPDPGKGSGSAEPGPELRDPREVHLSDILQLSDGGENAEAYWSFDGSQLIFQTTREPYACDQIMRMPADGSAPATLVSSGEGRTTCSYFMQGDREAIYASTHEAGAECPPAPDHSMGYVWALYDSYEIYRGSVDGGALTKLTDRVGYDAEATVCAVDGSVVFTSDRDGDLELYRMDADGGNVVRLTSTPGYDGGAFFNADCSKLVWRASRPEGEELAEFQRLLGEHLVRPGKLEIFVGNSDGSDVRQVTYLDAASFAPYFFPTGDRIIFSSNVGDPQGREFEIWAVDVDGTDLEQVTHSPGFDGFPMFSPDGTRLAFASNRNQAKEGETNVFVARWVDSAPVVDQESSADRFRAAVDLLADDRLAGRGVGTQGLTTAAGYIEDSLRGAGVDGGRSDGGFRQSFEVVTSLERGAGTTLAIEGKPVAEAGFTPLSFSVSKTVAGKLAVVAAGKETAGALKKAKLKGKIAVLAGGLAEGDSYDAAFHQRAIAVRQAGAIAVIFVDERGLDVTPQLAGDGISGDLGIPVMVVGKEVGVALTTGVAVKLAVELTPIKTSTDNVIGVIRAGAADKKEGAIVIGAHYDHLGQGGPGSLEASAGTHNGADDNASGVAALLEVARALVGKRDQLQRDVWIVAFSAEEMGVLGSAYFVAHPPGDQAVVAMLNMDMVGRMRDDTVQVLGAESATEWTAIVEPVCQAQRVRCLLSGSGYGPSDHMPFYIAGAPVLHFFTGSHLDYHRTGDDADKINAAGGAKVAAIVADTAVAVAGADPMTYVKAPPPPADSTRMRRGASLGTIPAYADEAGQTGMLLADVVPDGPADKAGLKSGDRIVQIGGVEVRTVYDLMYVLTNAKPGEKAKLSYVRAGKRTTVEVTYIKPRARH